MIRFEFARHHVVTIFLATAVAAIAASASADTIVLTALADTTLNQAAAGNNMGGHAQILAGADGSGRLRRGLLSFDIANEVPAGVIVHSATLYLTATSANPAAGDFHVHRMLASWSEGTGAGSTGEPAATGDATWNDRRHATAPWAAAGGLAGTDYAAASSTTTFVSAAGEYAFSGLAADVQRMVDDPGSNFGWMLISGREATFQSARQFVASEFGGAASPRLEIDYSAIPEPGSHFLMLAGLASASALAIIRARVARTSSGRA